MEMQKTPMWFRILGLILGILTIGLAVWIIALPAIAALWNHSHFRIWITLSGYSILAERNLCTRTSWLVKGSQHHYQNISDYPAVIPFTEPILGAVLVLWFMSSAFFSTVSRFDAWLCRRGSWLVQGFVDHFWIHHDDHCVPSHLVSPVGITLFDHYASFGTHLWWILTNHFSGDWNPNGPSP